MLQTKANKLFQRLYKAKRCISVLGFKEIDQANDLDRFAQDSIRNAKEILCDWETNPQTLEQARKTIAGADSISNLICRPADLTQFLLQNHTDPLWRLKAASANQIMNVFVHQLNSSSEIFKALEQILNGPIFHKLAPQEKRMVKDLYLDQLSQGFDHEKISQLQNSLYEKEHQFTQLLHKSPHSRRLVQIFEEILVIRKSLAEMHKFESFAQWKLRPCLLSTPEQVVNFLQELREVLQPLEGTDTQSFTDKKVFSRAKGSDFFFRFCQDSMGIRFEKVKSRVEELYGNTNVLKFHVWNESEQFLATVYMDFDRKIPSSCMYPLQMKYSMQPGILVLSTSMGETISFYQLSCLFHEFGHLLHAVLSETSFQHLSGTRGPMDYTEIPSTLMESFVRDPRILGELSHELTSHEIHEIIHSEQTSACRDLHFHCLLGLADQRFCSPEVSNHLSSGFSLTWWRQLGPRLPEKGYLRSTHLVGEYSGQYHSYSAAEVISSQLWERLFQSDPFSKQGANMMKLILDGVEDPLELLRAQVNLGDFGPLLRRLGR